MGKGTKILLGIVAACLLACVCSSVAGFVGLRYSGQVLSQSVTDKPDEVASIARKITDYDLPSGYNEEFGMSLLGYSMAGFGTPDKSTVVLLMQFPSYLNLSQADMEKQLQQQAQGRTSNLSSNLVPEGQTTVTIRGQEVTLLANRGTSEDGADIRQVTGFFSGKEGPSLLMIMGTVSHWDQKGLDYFISSLR